MKRYNRFKLLEISGWIFGSCALLLCLANALMQFALWEKDIWDIMWNCLIPVILAALIYMFHWDAFICFRPKRHGLHAGIWNGLLAVITVAVMMELHREDRLDVMVSVLPVFTLCVLAYTYQSLTMAAVTISLTSLTFVGFCGILPGSTTTIFVIIACTLGLLLSFGERDWIWLEGVPMKRYWLAAVIYGIAVVLLLRTTLMRFNLPFIDFRGTGFWNPDYVNDFCAGLFEEARLFGSVELKYGIDPYYEWNLAGVLARWGYVAWGTILAVCALMLITGGILVTYRIQHRFYAVGAYVLLAVQMVGHIVSCCGYEGFRTPRVMPLMADTLITNLGYLVMAVLILPPQLMNLFKPTEDEEYMFEEENWMDEDGIFGREEENPLHGNDDNKTE